MPNTPTPCPGPCSRNWRQAEATGLPHETQPTWGQPVHCHTCQDRTRTALGELPELLAAIWLEATHGTARPADVTTSRPANIAPWPGRPPGSSPTSSSAAWPNSKTTYAT